MDIGCWVSAIRFWGLDIGKQLVRAADSISANLAEGHGRYHFNDRLKYCYYARGSLEETKSWISKAMRRKLIATEISEINHTIELLPKKLNAYIKSIKKAREANKANTQYPVTQYQGA